MSVPSTNDEFMALLRRSKLLKEEQIADLLARVQPPPTEPKDLARAFVHVGLLTYFQAKHLLLGKWRGFTLGKYRVLEQLGIGGTGGVYLCQHRFMRRRVAVKVLPPAKAKDQATVERFYREARATAVLDHPNIVRAHDIDHEGNLHFLVMEYIDGLSLYEVVKKKGPLGTDRSVNYIAQAAEALQAVHKAGLVHRDVKPGNLVLERTGTIKLLDMGLARFDEDPKDALTDELDGSCVMGTADYLSPEQAINTHKVDIRSDIYSLGATLYFLLAGKPPFDGGSITSKLLSHQLHQPQPVRDLRGEVPNELAAIVEKMMAKDPAQRFQTPQDVIDALKPWQQPNIDPPAEDETPKISPAAINPPLMGDGTATVPAIARRRRPPSSLELPEDWFKGPQVHLPGESKHDGLQPVSDGGIQVLAAPAAQSQLPESLIDTVTSLAAQTLPANRRRALKLPTALQKHKKLLMSIGGAVILLFVIAGLIALIA